MEVIKVASIHTGTLPEAIWGFQLHEGCCGLEVCFLLYMWEVTGSKVASFIDFCLSTLLLYVIAFVVSSYWGKDNRPVCCNTFFFLVCLFFYCFCVSCVVFCFVFISSTNSIHWVLSDCFQTIVQYLWFPTILCVWFIIGENKKWHLMEWITCLKCINLISFFQRNWCTHYICAW